VHDPKGILPQGLAWALGKEDVNAWLAFTVGGCCDTRRRGGRSSAHNTGGAAAGNFLRLVNAAIVENVLQRIMMIVMLMLLAGIRSGASIDRVGGRLVSANNAAIIVSIKGIRKTVANII
jgi:hypothetical protein